LSDVDRIALIDPGGIPSDDDKVLGVGEISNDVLGDPICEPLPFWIVPILSKGKTAIDGLSGSDGPEFQPFIPQKLAAMISSTAAANIPN
jgi:hypothetical protein